jgi:hypothetical protein
MFNNIYNVEASLVTYYIKYIFLEENLSWLFFFFFFFLHFFLNLHYFSHLFLNKNCQVREIRNKKNMLIMWGEDNPTI